jgi:hypothetical protein
LYIFICKTYIFSSKLYLKLQVFTGSMLSTAEDCLGSNPQSWSVHPRMANRRSPLKGGCQVTWPWTKVVVGNVFGECHTPCKQKTSFVDFKKEQAHCNLYKRLHCLPLPNTQYFSSGYQKSLTRVDPSLPSFLYSS